jgi:hypothetical protein
MHSLRQYIEEQVRQRAMDKLISAGLVTRTWVLHCPAGHESWSGPSEQLEDARAKGCGTCSPPAPASALREDCRYEPTAVWGAALRGW